MIGNWNYGTGRRKTASARVRLSEGEGKIQVNDKELDEYFSLDQAVRDHEELVKRSLGRAVEASTDRFAALNAACCSCRPSRAAASARSTRLRGASA